MNTTRLSLVCVIVAGTTPVSHGQVSAETSRGMPLAELITAARSSPEVARAQGVDNPPSAFARDPSNTTSARIRSLEAQRRLGALREGEQSSRAWVASVLQADALGLASAQDFADAYLSYFSIRGRVLRGVMEWNLATVALRRHRGEFVIPR